jgi:hypothetical protein
MAVEVNQFADSNIFVNDAENMKAHYKILINENKWLKKRIIYLERQSEKGQEEIIKQNKTIRELTLKSFK